MTIQGKARQGQTRQGQTRQGKARQVKTSLDKISHENTRQDKTIPDKTRQKKTRQDQTRQDKTRSHKTRPRSPKEALFLPVFHPKNTWLTLLTQWKLQYAIFFESMKTFVRSMSDVFNSIAIYFSLFCFHTT